jgi:Transposase, Mutator family
VRKCTSGPSERRAVICSVRRAKTARECRGRVSWRSGRSSSGLPYGARFPSHPRSTGHGRPQNPPWSQNPARIDGSEAADDVLAYMHFPRDHWRQLHSTNTLERIHKEIKRRTRVVGIFPNRDSLMRMVATLLQEQDDEWQVMDRRYFSIESMRRINEQLEGGETPKELLAAIA